MLTVACVLRSGGIYTPDHVRILEAMVSRHLDGIERFVCLTDQPLNLPHVETIPLHHNWPGAWSRLELFRPIFREGDRILYFDLAVVISGSLSSMAQRSEHFLTRGPENFEVMLWTAGNLYDAYRNFARRPNQWTFAEVMQLYAPRPTLWHHVLPGQVAPNPDLTIARDVRVRAYPGIYKPWDQPTSEFVATHYTAEVNA